MMVHPKIKVLSFTQSYVISNPLFQLYNFCGTFFLVCSFLLCESMVTKTVWLRMSSFVFHKIKASNRFGIKFLGLFLYFSLLASFLCFCSCFLCSLCFISLYHSFIHKTADIKIHLSLLFHLPLPTCVKNKEEKMNTEYLKAAVEIWQLTVFFPWLCLGLPGVQPHVGVRTTWLHLRPLNTWLYFGLLTHQIHLGSMVPHFHHGPSSLWLRWAPTSIWLVRSRALSICQLGSAFPPAPQLSSVAPPPSFSSKHQSLYLSHEPLALSWPSRPAVTPCVFSPLS